MAQRAAVDAARLLPQRVAVGVRRAIVTGAHYQSMSVANGVVYAVDGLGGFDAWYAASGDAGAAPRARVGHGPADRVAYERRGRWRTHTVFVAAGATGGPRLPDRVPRVVGQQSGGGSLPRFAVETLATHAPFVAVRGGLFAIVSE